MGWVTLFSVLGSLPLGAAVGLLWWQLRHAWSGQSLEGDLLYFVLFLGVAGCALLGLVVIFRGEYG